MAMTKSTGLLRSVLSSHSDLVCDIIIRESLMTPFFLGNLYEIRGLLQGIL